MTAHDMMEISTALLWATIIGLVVYWYFIKTQNYWKKTGIPYVPTYPIVGSLLWNFRKPIHEKEVEKYNKFGRIYGYYEMSLPVISIAEPHLLRDILVKDFPLFANRREFASGHQLTDKMLFIVQGDEWKRIRSVISPLFSTGQLKSMLNIFKECSTTLGDKLFEHAKSGNPINPKISFNEFGLHVLVGAVYSSKIDSHNDSYNKFAVEIKKYFEIAANQKFVFFLFRVLPSLGKFLNKLSKSNPADPLADMIRQFIDERKRSEEKFNDFLQLLIDSEIEINDDEIENNDVVKNDGYNKSNPDLMRISRFKKKLSKDEIIAQTLAFFFAGFDNVGTTLSLACYELGLNEKIQEKALSEIDEVLQENEGELTYEGLKKMIYLENIIDETLRKYPLEIDLDREVAHEYVLGDTGIKIPKGALITIPVYAIHRDKDFYPNPEIFNPDRFNEDAKSTRVPYSYLPFGSGPRNCVAMRFALIEMKTCLALLLSRFRVKTSPEMKVPLNLDVNAIRNLEPKNILLNFEIRNSSIEPK